MPSFHHVLPHAAVLGAALFAAGALRAQTAPAGAPPPAAAIDTLAGTVTDPGGRPVERATVALPELGRVAVTGADGGFRMVQVPAGRYTLVVRRLGYAAGVRELTLAPGQPVAHR